MTGANDPGFRKSAAAQTLRKRAEAKVSTANKPYKDMSASQISKLVHELRIHQVELELQNEELSKSQAETERSRKAYQDLWQLSPVGYLIVDVAGRVSAVNRAGQRLLGRPENALLNERFTTLVAPDNQVPVHLMLERAVETGIAERQGIRIKKPDGAVHICLLEVRSLEGESGREQIQAVLTDITRQKQAEDDLRKNEQEKIAILDSLIEHVVYHDSQMKILYANKAACKAAHMKREDLLDCNCYEVWADRRTFCEDCPVIKARDTGQPQMNEMMTPDGRWWYIKGHPVRAKNGRVTGMTELTMDITERKQAEEERKILQAHLIQSQKMEAIATLAGGIAHNFNNVLMGIQGRASLMIMDKDPSHPDYKHLNGIEESVRRAAELTRDLLGFARGGKYEAKPTDLNTLIKHESMMFGRTKKEIQIHEKYNNDLWAVEVDRGQIKKILLNLYMNAWQAMPGGGDLYIQTDNVTLDEACIRPPEVTLGRYVKISVTDTGTGMDETSRQRIFDPFFPMKDTGRGSGLGLASVYGIVKHHGGFINVYSEKGEGTTFNIYLPASEKELVEEGPGPDRNKVQYGEGTVLLVDDEAIIIDVGQQMLERLGYRVLIARSGRDALDVYGKSREEIDLVILDMIMPDMGGSETYDRIKDIDESVMVLLSSGYSTDGQAKEIMDRGCQGFIQKPFSINDLSIKVREALDEARG